MLAGCVRSLLTTLRLLLLPPLLLPLLVLPLLLDVPPAAAEPLDVLLQLPLVYCLSDGCKEAQPPVCVVHLQQHASQHLVGVQQVVDVGPAVVLAGETAAARNEGTLV